MVVRSRGRRVAAKVGAPVAGTTVAVTAARKFALRGELDPTVAHLAGAGPIDTLRALADDRTQPETDPVVRDAHHGAAAGIVRLVQRWPHAGDEGPALAALATTLELVPADGEASIVIRPDGALELTYSQTVPR